MSVHHDKSIYGKLASMREAMSDDDVANMARELMEWEESEGNVDGDEKTKHDERKEETWAKSEKKSSEKA